MKNLNIKIDDKVTLEGMTDSLTGRIIPDRKHLTVTHIQYINNSCPHYRITAINKQDKNDIGIYEGSARFFHKEAN